MATDSGGNQAVDYVWGGTLAPQPDTGRATPLDASLGDHVVYKYGWAGYPSFEAGVGIAVPDLNGLTEANAETALLAVGLVKGTVTGSGNVDTQDPVAGTSVALGTAVDLDLA